MRVSREQAAWNRDRILASASKLFRERGFDGVGVDALMKSVGLTHGGFYGHFGSKEDLAAEAVALGLAESTETQKGQTSLQEMVDRYLSTRHRDDVANGCLLAAIGGDLGRQNSGVRQAVTDYVRGQISRIAKLMGARREDERRAQAIATLSGLVGALTLARAVEDPDLSDDILRAARSVFGTRCEPGAE